MNTICTAAALLPFLSLAMTAAEPLPEPANLPLQPEVPDVLLLSYGERVGSKEEWQEKRAPELRRLVQHYEYGYFPPKPQKFAAQLLREDPQALGGKATLKEVEIRCTKPDAKVHLLIVVPNQRTGPVPCFLGLNFGGNYAVVADPQVRMPEGWVYEKFIGHEMNRAAEEGRGKEVEIWAIERSIDRGYAVATFYNGDIVPDQADLAHERLKQFVPPGVSPDDPAAPATIAAWAWGFSRMIDYLVTDAQIDAKRIAVVGHSRNGKTALLAGAMDERIALVIPSQAGCGGTAPVRVAPELLASEPNGRPKAETIAAINKNFPHWFNSNFKQFNAAPEKLPFDQHALIALCAPRPVLLTNAVEDVWANPTGQFEMLRAAEPAYRLVAGGGLAAAKMPPVGELMDSRLGYFIRPGEHAMTASDWKVWLDYADRWLK
jgi:hypothetical protein